MGIKVEGSLNFSKHAAKRLNERNIQADGQFKDILEQAVKEARDKGARNVAVIGNEEAFIVNVRNNIVVTAMSRDDMTNKVFTNIDSAVLLQSWQDRKDAGR